MNVNNIADEAYYSKYHFIRFFSKTYGKTPYQYLKQVRIHEVTRLLKDNISVSEVCFSVGFESLSSFSSLFKRYAGM